MMVNIARICLGKKCYIYSSFGKLLHFNVEMGKGLSLEISVLVFSPLQTSGFILFSIKET